MQVLKASKGKFVSAVGGSLLTSLWVCLWSSHSSRSYCLTLKKENLLLTLELFPDAAGRGGLGSIFSPKFIIHFFVQPFH